MQIKPSPKLLKDNNQIHLRFNSKKRSIGVNSDENVHILFKRNQFLVQQNVPKQDKLLGGGACLTSLCNKELRIEEEKQEEIVEDCSSKEIPNVIPSQDGLDKVENKPKLRTFTLYIDKIEIKDKDLTLLSLLEVNSKKCKNIRSLSVGLYEETGATNNLFTILSNYTNLTSLKLLFANQKWLGDQEICSLSKVLANYQDLTSLNLEIYDIYISKIGMVSLSNNGLSNCKNLTKLSLTLSFNSNRDEGMTNLGSALANCEQLKSLNIDLRDNYICDDGLSNFSEAVFSKCILLDDIHLQFENNRISNIGIQNLMKGLANCPSLQSLKMHFEKNNIRSFRKEIGGKTSYLDTVFSHLKNLTSLELFLSDNPFYEDELKSLGNSIGFIHNLINLTFFLSFEKMSGKGFIDAIQGLTNCTNLRKLCLFLNSDKLQCSDVQSVGVELSKCKNLNHLEIAFLGLNIEIETKAFLKKIPKLVLLEAYF